MPHKNKQTAKKSVSKFFAPKPAFMQKLSPNMLAAILITIAVGLVGVWLLRNTQAAQSHKPTTLTVAFQNLGFEEGSAKAVFQKIHDKLGKRQDVLYNFAEISASNEPDERGPLRAVFGKQGWSGEKTQTPTISRLSKGWSIRNAQVVKLHGGVPRVSPPRFMVVTQYVQKDGSEKKLAIINTHFINNAYNNHHIKEFQMLWDKAFNKLKQRVAALHEAGYDVIVSGDFNREVNFPKIHRNSQVAIAEKYDRIMVVPAKGRSCKILSKGIIDTPSGEPIHKTIWANIRFLGP